MNFGECPLRDWVRNNLDVSRHDPLTAVSLLTRIPVPSGRRSGRLAESAWAWPLVGAAAGAVAAIAGWSLLWLGVPSGMTAGIALAVLVGLTGALHEDGLADSADGLAGGSTPERRLSIMKDSRIGAVGALALALAVVCRWTGIEQLDAATILPVLVAVGAASRLPMVLAMLVMPPARSSGLSAAVGRPGPQTALLATIVAAVICIGAAGLPGLVVFAVAAVGAVPVCVLAMLRIGGQTGDILGACQQCAEISALAAAAAIISS